MKNRREVACPRPISFNVNGTVSRRWFVYGLAAFFPLLLALVGCNDDRAMTGSAATVAGDVVTSEVESGPVRMRVRVSPSKPRLSDLVELDIEIDSEPNVVIEPPVFGQSVGDFLVRDYRELGKDRDGGKLPAGRRLFRYQLEPVHSGKHLIRAIAIHFTDKRSESEQSGKTARLESRPLEVEVTSEIGAAVPDLGDLVPMEEPIGIEESAPWLWIATLMVLASFFVGLLWFTRKTPVHAKEALRLSPEELARQELNTLLAANLPAQGQMKEFFVRITGIVRTFIEGSTGIRAPEQTTEEFLRESKLGLVFLPDQAVQLVQFLEAADMVKYAGQNPDPSQVASTIANAQNFIAMKFQEPPWLNHPETQ